METGATPVLRVLVVAWHPFATAWFRLRPRQTHSVEERSAGLRPGIFWKPSSSRRVGGRHCSFTEASD